MTTVSGEIRELLARARHSRRAGYAAPVVASLADAERLVAAITAQAEMTATARQLAEARKGSAACRSYAVAGRGAAQ